MIRSSSSYNVVELVIIIMAKFACCMNNVLAAKILAVVNLVLAVLTLVHEIYLVAEEKQRESNSNQDGLKEMRNKFLRFFFLLGAVASIIDDIILMIGAFKKSRCLLIIWMVIAAILTFSAIITFMWNFSVEDGFKPADYVIQLAIIGFNVWTLFVVGGAIKEIREGA